MDWEKLDPLEKQKYYEKGYSDLKFFLLRNGGMFRTKIRDNSIWSRLWNYNPIIQICVYMADIPLLVYSLYTERHNVDNFLESAHFLVMIWSLMVGNMDFLYYREDLNILLRYVGTEFYQYDEKEPQLYKNMKKATIQEIKKISIIGSLMYISMGVVISVLQPYIYYLSTKDHMEIKPINPYLPVYMYIPWDTYTIKGYIAAYTLQSLGTAFVVLNVIANGFSYVNLIIMLRCQLEILNHSVLNIESRAVERFRKRNGIKPDGAMMRNRRAFDEEMKQCLCDCLKQNIKHHQCLLSWEIRSRKMLRVILLFVFFNASILMAASGYLLLKNMNSKIRTFKFVQLLVLEIFHTFLFCYYGEQIVKQSEDLFRNLHRTNWFNYGRKFNRLLSVMITKSEKPIMSRTAIFNTPCNLETFNNLMSTAYSYFNLINQMKDGI